MNQKMLTYNEYYEYFVVDNGSVKYYEYRNFSNLFFTIDSTVQQTFFDLKPILNMPNIQVNMHTYLDGVWSFRSRNIYVFSMMKHNVLLRGLSNHLDNFQLLIPDYILLDIIQSLILKGYATIKLLKESNIFNFITDDLLTFYGINSQNIPVEFSINEIKITKRKNTNFHILESFFRENKENYIPEIMENENTNAWYNIIFHDNQIGYIRINDAGSTILNGVFFTCYVSKSISIKNIENDLMRGFIDFASNSLCIPFLYVDKVESRKYSASFLESNGFVRNYDSIPYQYFYNLTNKMEEINLNHYRDENYEISNTTFFDEMAKILENAKKK